MDLTSLTPLPGGWSGQTFLGRVGEDRCVVRIYAEPGPRGDAAAEVDAALLRLVRGLVPVPDVLEVRRPDAATGVPGLLVTGFVEGVRGDELLPTLDDEGLSRVGTALGDVVATLAGMPQLTTGSFVDGDLTVEPWGDLEPVVPDDLRPAERSRLLDRWAEALDLLDGVPRRVLVHSDLNPKNVLLDPDTLTVTALVDWEHAHAGHPYTDLGNLLRFDRQPPFLDAVLAAYCSRHGGTPEQALALADAADLWALCELASRRGQNPVADRAHALLRRLDGDTPGGVA
jgi:aminoglycoside phosphotransferase (APT) family kinase protein